MQIRPTLHKIRRPAALRLTYRAAKLAVILLFLVVAFAASAADGWDDWGGDWGTTVGGSSEPKVRRPFVSGWWNWQYNEFSSFDQGRINFEKDLGQGSKLVTGARVNYYTEDNNKKWKVFPGENYYFFKAGDFDFKVGMLIENIPASIHHQLPASRIPGP